MKAVAFAVIVFFVCIARIAVATEDFIVEVEQNKVSIKATDVSLKALLFKLGEKADIAVRFTSDVDEKITISLREVSIKDAITKITPDNLSVFHNRRYRRGHRRGDETGKIQNSTANDCR